MECSWNWFRKFCKKSTQTVSKLLFYSYCVIFFHSKVLAHELGHNFGMSHDFDEKHGGDNGPCNGQGIMSYGSYDFDQWSTCSRSDFEEHYASQNWGDGCLEDISGIVFPA